MRNLRSHRSAVDRGIGDLPPLKLADQHVLDQPVRRSNLHDVGEPSSIEVALGSKIASAAQDQDLRDPLVRNAEDTLPVVLGQLAKHE